MKITLTSSLGMLVAIVSSALAAPETATFTFPAIGADGNVTSFAYNGSSIEGLIVSAITKNGVTTSSSNNNFRATDWSLGATNGSDSFTGALDASDFFEVTFSASEGFLFDVTEVTFGIGRSAAGPRQAAWSSDVSFSTPLPVTIVNAGLTHSSGVLTTPDANSNWTANSIALSGASYTDLSSRTFRFYMWNSESAAGTGGLQGPLSFTISVTEIPAPIPEPSTYAAIFGAIVLAGVATRRRRSI